jgi:hypothetical protein
MPTLTVENFASLSEYIAFVERQTDNLWYRGVGDSGYELKPSLYRHPELTDASLLYEKEFEILKKFKQRSIPYIERDLRGSEDLSILFIMQHYRVPTRLLDWTENPYIGLYFALTEAKYKKVKTEPEYETDAAVWVLSPSLWNQRALDEEPSPGIISPPDDDHLNGYKPGSPYRKPEPIALYGDYNSSRIVAQKGVFTLFGNRTRPMEQSYIVNDYPQDSLRKLIFKKEHIKKILNVLIRTGITDSVVFPDLEGLAKELKRQFGYWV